MQTRRLTSDQRQKLIKYRYVLILMKLHSIDNFSLFQVLEEENRYMHASRIRNMQDCLVYLAWIIRLWIFYFWSAIKNFRWLKYSISPRGRVEVNFTHTVYFLFEVIEKEE